MRSCKHEFCAKLCSNAYLLENAYIKTYIPNPCMSADLTIDLTTRATVTHTVVTDVKLSTGATLTITEGQLQFGANNNTKPIQIRLWTHANTTLTNDLATLGMAGLSEVCGQRSTRNIVAETIALEDFVRHEMSPGARLLHMKSNNLPELWTNLSVGLDDKLATSAAGHAYTRRTDIVVVHQTAAHYIDAAALDMLKKRENVVVLFLATNVDTGLGRDTVLLSKDARAVHGMSTWTEELRNNSASMTSVFRHLLQYLPEEFQSCQAPQENLQLHVSADTPIPCYLSDTFLGMSSAEHGLPVASCVSLFTPYTLYAMGDVHLHYSVTVGFTSVSGTFADAVTTEVTTLSELLRSKPALQVCLARFLYYHATVAAPPQALAHLLTPYDTLVKHAASLKDSFPVEREALQRVANSLLINDACQSARSAAAADKLRAFHASMKAALPSFTNLSAGSLVNKAVATIERNGDWCLSDTGSASMEYMYASAQRAALAQMVSPLQILQGGGAHFLLAAPARAVSQSASYSGGMNV